MATGSAAAPTPPAAEAGGAFGYSDIPTGCSVASSPTPNELVDSRASLRCLRRSSNVRGVPVPADSTASIPIVKKPASPASATSPSPPAAAAATPSIAPNDDGGARILISSIGRFSGTPI